jgi:hypothetical protein
MKSRIGRISLVAAEIVGVAVAAILGLSAFLFWRVQSGPLDLDWSAPAIRGAANAFALNGAVRRIDGVTLEKLDDQGGYRLRLEKIRLGQRDGEASALVSDVELALYPRDLLAGKIGPRRLVINGLALRIVRRADRQVKLDFGETVGDRARVFQTITGGPYFREAFERAALNHVSINFVDEGSGRTWQAKNAAALVTRTPAGYAATINAAFDTGSGAAGLLFQSSYGLQDETIKSRLHLDKAPVGDLIAVFFNAKPDLLTSLVSGKIDVDLTSGGRVKAARMALRGGEGVLSLGGGSTKLKGFDAIAAFDPARNEFDVKRLAIDSDAGEGTIDGVASLTQAPSGREIETIEFALKGDSVVKAPSLFAQPVALGGLSATGRYEVATRALSITSLFGEAGAARLDGTVYYRPTREKTPIVKGALKIAGPLAPTEVLALWPRALAEGAREFVASRVPTAHFSAIDLTVDVKPGSVDANGALRDEALTLSFKAEEAEVLYAPGMTPFTRVVGEGLLRGNSFRFTAKSGAVGTVAVKDALVDIPVLKPRGEYSTYRFNVAGDAGALMSELARPPLAALRETKLTPAQFSGPVEASVEIKRPNLKIAPPDSYRYSGVARFSDVAIEDFFRDATLASGKGVLNLETDGIAVEATAVVASAPVTIDWKQKFKGRGDRSFYVISGEADSSTADIFGIPTRQLIQGPVAFNAKAVGQVGGLRRIDLEADFTRAAMMSEALGWLKPQGSSAKGSAVIELTPGAVKARQVKIVGDGVAVEGEADFGSGGRLDSATIPTLRLEGASDLSFTAERSADGRLAMTLTGAFLNGEAIARRLATEGFGGDESGGRGAMALTARIGEVSLRGGVSYRDASIDFQREGESVTALSLSAMGDERRPVSVQLRPDGEAGVDRQSVEARTDDIGALLRGVFGFQSVRGGRGQLELELSPGERRAGRMRAANIRVVDAPLLAKIFAAGSLDGLEDLVSGDGIEFTTATTRFEIERGELKIREARATGPSVGVTAQGSFSLAEDRAVSLSGAVAPVYGVNSILGRTPFIGDLFVNRQGEGLIALSYSVSGSTAEPRVTVNPLSALAPGVLRRMFETDEAPAEIVEDKP